MRGVYTPQAPYGPVARAYVRLHVGDRFALALIDTGADATVLTKEAADLLGVPYAEAEPSVGVGGPVRTFRAVRRITVGLEIPRLARGRLDWVHLGSYLIRPAVIPSAVPGPSLVGRSDLLRRFRFCLSDADGTFELRAVA